MNLETEAMNDPRIAYFSMEIALRPEIPTYAGGLGALAGDTLRSASDMRIPMIGVTLLHRNGYFFQRLDPTGWQVEQEEHWVVEDYLQKLAHRVSVTLDGQDVSVGCWKYAIRGNSGFEVPVVLLDTNLEENADWHRSLTSNLYGGDSYYRLCQEAVLGIGGVRMLREMGLPSISTYHMNEGHASLLGLELLNEHLVGAGRDYYTDDDLDSVRKQCVFTTHTPVSAGHDRFPLDLAARVLGISAHALVNHDIFCCEGELNLTYLALNVSHYVNGVAKKHGEVSRLMFTNYHIDAITNGVHAETWVAPPLAALYDRYIAGWRQDNFMLRYALNLPSEEIWKAHLEAKRSLITFVNRETNAGLDANVLTIGFARRAASYKRTALVFNDLERIRDIASNVGPFQFIFAGKAHPNDDEGKKIIQRVVDAGKQLRGIVNVTYLENYDMQLAKRMTAGVDVWLNTPQPPMEASGTSGMKAALNGVPSLSVLDGWWIEGHIENVTGWSIGDDGNDDGRERWVSDANSFYEKLEDAVLEEYYGADSKYVDIMRHCIALNGSFFNTQRMLLQYVTRAYFT